MAERLTEKDKYGNNAIFQNKDKFTIAKDKNNDIRVYGKAIDKLAQLEDIMAKYGIEDLEQYVEEKRKQDKELRDNIQQLHTIINSTGYDRDTWKKACELACDDLGLYEDVTTTQLKMKCYYQQAKKEKDENKN